MTYDYWGSDIIADLFDQTGAAELTFNGPSGFYRMEIGYFDEDDGGCPLSSRTGEYLARELVC